MNKPARDDVVEKLEALATTPFADPMWKEAADEITRLRKELADRDREYICSCGRRVSPHVCNPYKLF